jgi:hypothetical protein
MDGTGFGGLTRVAVLVDGDNVSSRHQGAVMAEARQLGRVDVRRVYGDTGNFDPWEGFRSVHAGGAKNAADMFLVVDAMALALSDGIGAFVIVSCDRDFAPVALALRERGLVVVGAGRERSGLTFQQSCSRFVVLEQGGGTEVVKAVAAVTPADTLPMPAALAPTKQPVKVMPARLSAEHRRAVELIREKSGANLIMPMSLLGSALGPVPKGRGRWQTVLKERPDVFAFYGEGKALRVSLLPAAANVR